MIKLISVLPKSTEDIHLYISIVEEPPTVPDGSLRHSLEQLPALRRVRFTWRNRCYDHGDNFEAYVGQVRSVLHGLNPGLVDHDGY